MKKGLLSLFLIVFIFLSGCSDTAKLSFDDVQTQLIEMDTTDLKTIIPRDAVDVPAEVRGVIDGLILDFETFIGPHVNAFASYEDISADDLVRIALLTSAGADNRIDYLKISPSRFYSIPYDKLPGWLEPIFGSHEYLALRNSTYYKSVTDSFDLGEGEISYTSHETVLVCEDYEVKGDMLRIKISRYISDMSIRTDGVFAGTRGYELVKENGEYRLTRMVEYVKPTDEEKEVSEPLVIDPM